MDQLYDDVKAIAAAYQRKPLTAVAAPLAETQDAIFSLLETRQRPNQSRDLYVLAGVTSGLLGKAAHDLSDSHSAMAHARTAFLCAENADHDGLRSWVCGLQSLISYWARRYGDALSYAQQGMSFAQKAGGTTTVWLPASEARAWAAMGNVHEASAAVARAERAWNNLKASDLDSIGGPCTFSESRQVYYVAEALSRFSDATDQAEDYSRRAVEAYADEAQPDWSFGDQSGSYASLAYTHVGRGQLDGAEAAISPVLSLPPEQRINGIVAAVARVQHAIERSPLAPDPAATSLREQISDFVRLPAVALPR